MRSDAKTPGSLLLMRGLLVTALGVMLLQATLVTTYRVAGSSMQPSLVDGDRILVIEAFPFGIDPGDTVILEIQGEVLVKRVVALPGDAVAMERGTVIRNGRIVYEDLPDEMRTNESFPTYRLGADEFFVLGDNRPVSVDSREFGPVRRDCFVGEVVLRLPGRGASQVSAREP